MRPPSETGENKFWEPGSTRPTATRPTARAGRDGRSTNARGGVLQSRRSRRARAEARAPMRGSSRVCRGVWRSRRCPARCAALRGATRRRGAARSSCAAAGCWCPAPAPPPSRGRCAQQPRAAGALCPLRRRAAAPSPQPRPSLPALRLPAATQIAQQPHRAATRHFSSPPETRTARGSCLYLPAGARHPPRPIWR